MKQNRIRISLISVLAFVFFAMATCLLTLPGATSNASAEGNAYKPDADYIRLELTAANVDTEGFIVYLTPENKSFGWCEEPTNGLFARFKNNGSGNYELYFKLKTNGSSVSSEAWGHPTDIAVNGKLSVELKKNADGTATILLNGVNCFTDHFSASVFDSIRDANGYTYFASVCGGTSSVTLDGVVTETIPENACSVADYIRLELTAANVDTEGFIVYLTPENKSFGWCEEPTNGLFARFKINGSGNYELYFKLKTNGSSVSSEAWGHPTDIAVNGKLSVELKKNADGTATILLNGVNCFTDHFSASVFNSIRDANGYTYFASVCGGTSSVTLDGVTTTEETKPIENEDWSEIYDLEENGNVLLAGGAYYKHGLHLEAGHIRVTLDIRNFASSSGTRIGFAFMNTPDCIFGATYCYSGELPSATGLIVWFTNENGKMLVNMCNPYTGKFDFLALNDSSDYAATGAFKIDLYKNGENLRLFLNDKEYVKSSFAAVLCETLVDKNGYTYFSYDSYSEGGNYYDNTMIEVLDVVGEFPADVSVPDFGTVLIKDRATVLPAGTVEGYDGEAEITAELNGREIPVTNRTITPSEVGECKITYSVTIDGTYSEKVFTLTVMDAQASVATETLRNPENWVGGVVASDEGISADGAYVYYKQPLSTASGFLSVTFTLNGLSAQNENDAWVCVAFVTAGTFTSPAGFAGDGLHFWFGNNAGKLVVNAAYKTAIGVEDLVHNTFSDLNAIGEHKIDVLQNGQSFRLFVDEIEIMSESLEKLYFEDMLDRNACTYLSIARYSANGDLSNASCGILSFSYENDKDLTPPVIEVGNVPSEGTVGSPVSIPEGTATDDRDGAVACTFTVIDPDGISVSVINGTFTPEKAGTYIVRYSASDGAGNVAEEKVFRITVSEEKAPESKGCLGSVGHANGLFAALALLCFAGVCFRKKAA